MSRYGTSQDDSPDMLFRKLQNPQRTFLMEQRGKHPESLFAGAKLKKPRMGGTHVGIVESGHFGTFTGSKSNQKKKMGADLFWVFFVFFWDFFSFFVRASKMLYFTAFSREIDAFTHLH